MVERRSLTFAIRNGLGRCDAGDVLGYAADDFHVLDAGAAVLGGDVVTTEVLEEGKKAAKKLAALTGSLVEKVFV